ncbi:hypothetical protein ACE6H2_015486 [Prunus campanulata]
MYCSVVQVQLGEVLGSAYNNHPWGTLVASPSSPQKPNGSGAPQERSEITCMQQQQNPRGPSFGPAVLCISRVLSFDEIGFSSHVFSGDIGKDYGIEYKHIINTFILNRGK